jgi:RNA polymerase sigma-54 factor
MKPSLHLSLTHHLTMTPQLQQAIRLLQLSSLDLLQEIQQNLYNNPLLELEESEDLSGSKSDSLECNFEENPLDTSEERFEEGLKIKDWGEKIPTDLSLDTKWDDAYEPSHGQNNAEQDFSPYEGPDQTGDSLKDYLMWQLNLASFSEIQSLIGENVIDSIDEKGMLTTTAEDIYALLGGSASQEEVYLVIHQIQQFDPPGIGASTLAESLLLQLNQLSEDTKYLKEAQLLVSAHIDLLGTHNHRQLQKNTGFTEASIAAAILLIKTLSPYPGDNWNNSPIEYVTPDIRTFKSNGSWIVLLNGDITPKLKINQQYASLIKRGDHGADNDFIKNHFQDAKWFIRSIENRNETLLRVASCIIEQQHEFLEKGPVAMKPMILKDVADKLELHESTVSRATTQKYIATPLGVFELKYFFSSHVKTQSGEEFSSTAIRAILKKLVAAEDPAYPLSDSKLTALLNELGINIARRTVAKYREGIGVASSSQRKAI